MKGLGRLLQIGIPNNLGEVSLRSISNHPRTKAAYDVTIIGGGIVGCASARHIRLRHPNLRIALIEKEHDLALHQSQHNSGVIHAGIYYQPGSMKAKLCVKGVRMLYEYCDKNEVPYNKCGKLIVALDRSEIGRLDALFDRGNQNNVPGLELVNDPKGIKEYEPHCNGVKAIWSPNTGIIDFGVLARRLAAEFKEAGGEVLLNSPVTGIQMASPANADHPVQIRMFNQEPILTKYVITSSGLYSDRVSGMTGCSSNPKIVPFRGEWLVVKPEARKFVRGNIYPVPDPRFPFLGVHFTPRMNGDLWIGPNAVLAAAREGYNWRNVNVRDLLDALKFRGMQKLMLKHLVYGLGEFRRSLSNAAEMQRAVKYVPNITADMVQSKKTSGVRAMALAEDGTMIEDFVWDDGQGELAKLVLHLRNAPSPAATASLEIAEEICNKATEKFSL